MTQSSPLMVVLQDPAGQEYANQLATAMGYASADVVYGTLADAAEAIIGRGLMPSYVLADIGSMAPDEVLRQLEILAQQCEPHTHVVVMGDVNDITLYRELKQRGVIEYFTKPAGIPQLRAALMSQPQGATQLSGVAPNQPKQECGVVTFMSAASGDGSSTVAINTAYALAERYGQSTVVIDMDYQFGMIARNLDLSCPFGIKDIFEYPDRVVDSTLADKMLVGYNENMKVIAAPNDLRILPPIKPEVIRNLIHTLRSQFKFIIIDLPHIWSPWVAAALSESTHCVMVSQLWLRSVTHSSRMLKSWREIGIPGNKTSIIVNRSGSKFKEAVTAKDYERVCGKEINFFLANDTKSVVQAENQGKTVLEVGHSALSENFENVAAYLISQRDGVPYTPSQQTTAKGGLTSLFQRK